MMSGHSPNLIFFNKYDWTLRTLAAPPNPSTSVKDPFLSYPNPTPIYTYTHPNPTGPHFSHQTGCHMCIAPNLFPCRLGYISQK